MGANIKLSERLSFAVYAIKKIRKLKKPPDFDDLFI